MECIAPGARCPSAILDGCQAAPGQRLASTLCANNFATNPAAVVLPIDRHPGDPAAGSSLGLAIAPCGSGKSPQFCVLVRLLCSAAVRLHAAAASNSVARTWDERALAAIRADTPHPPAQARNLFSLSVWLYDAWDTGNVSYDLGDDAEATKPAHILSADRSMTGFDYTGLHDNTACCTINLLNGGKKANWAPALCHGAKAGNLGFSDGSVQQSTDTELRDTVLSINSAETLDGTLRFYVP